MKVCITGGLGHIGSHLITQLRNELQISNLCIVDNLSSQRYCSLMGLEEHHRLTFHELDCRDKQMEDIVADSNIVLHLAAITNAENSVKIPELVHENNFSSTKTIADFCVKHNTKLIALSSTSVYGPQGEVVDEDCAEAELAPQSPYAETKLLEEDYLKDLAQREGLQVCILRFGTIFGWSAGMRFHTAVNKFCWQAATGLPLTIWKTALHQKRPYLSLRDATTALQLIISKDIFSGDLLNVLTGNFTVEQIITEIKKTLPETNISFVDSQIMNQLSYNVSCEKLGKLGWKSSSILSQDISNTLRQLQHLN